MCISIQLLFIGLSYILVYVGVVSSNSDTLYLNNTLNNMWSNMHIVLCLGSMTRSTLVRAFFLSTKQNYKYFLVRAFVSLSFVSLSLVSRSFVSLSLYKCDMISLYSSMVERNTVNIMIDVQFILRAIKSYY